MKVLITKDPITINFVGGPTMNGYVNGYLFDRNLPDGAADNSNHITFEKFALINDNFAPGFGCVRIVHRMHAIVKNCP
jgi:hypothetical protein